MLKINLPYLISDEQSAFVPGRAITDNVIVAFEIIHIMKRMTKGKIGTVALKIDISKAYDRIRWPYLKAVLCRMGFFEKWVKWIMLCVSSVTYYVLVNNHHVGPLFLKEGFGKETLFSVSLHVQRGYMLCLRRQKLKMLFMV